MSTMNRPAEQLSDDLNAASHDFKSGIAAVKEDLNALKHDAMAAASCAARDAAQIGKETMTKVRDQAGDLQAKTAELVRANPFAAVFISIGIGALLARLLSRD